MLINMYTIKMNRRIPITESNNLAGHRITLGCEQTW